MKVETCGNCDYCLVNLVVKARVAAVWAAIGCRLKRLPYHPPVKELREIERDGHAEVERIVSNAMPWLRIGCAAPTIRIAEAA